MTNLPPKVSNTPAAARVADVALAIGLALLLLLAPGFVKAPRQIGVPGSAHVLTR